ncbi:MAG: ATP-grasp fold amidoligase family protein [Candidatus Limivicinus sp.]|nr:ATP-grasp fold amidoligase family protein [Candidatus Limivicinus sp.]
MSIAGLKYYLSSRANMFDFFASRNMLNWMSDEAFLKRKFKLRMGYELDLDNPKTFNEKLQWLKLYDRNPLYTKLVDKYEVRKYIAEKIGEEYLIPLVGGPWNSPEEIDFDALPDQFVLKCTHDSGSVVICKDKSKLDIPAAKAKLSKHLKRNYYWTNREWPYKNVPPRIIAEKYMEDETGELRDFKFLCFNGMPRMMYISRDAAADTTTDFFDMDFNHLPIRMKDPNSAILPTKPECFEEMQRIASVLSEGIPHVRTDFYCANSKIYFGELTFFHNGGFTGINPAEWNYKVGSWIKLPRKE